MNFFDLVRMKKQIEAMARKEKNTVKRPTRKFSFSIDDTKRIERYLGQKIRVKRNRLCSSVTGDPLTSSLKDDLDLLKQARSNLK